MMICGVHARNKRTYGFVADVVPQIRYKLRDRVAQGDDDPFCRKVGYSQGAAVHACLLFLPHFSPAYLLSKPLIRPNT